MLKRRKTERCHMRTLAPLATPEVVVLTTHGTASDDKAGSVTTPGIEWRGFLNFTPVTSCRPYVKKIRHYITTMRNIHFTDIITRGFRYITVSITRYRTKIREEKAKALVWLSSESINPQKIPHNSPLRASYGASFWVFVWKIGARCR